MTAPKYLSATQAAAALKLSRQRIHQLLQQGRIAGAFLVGKHWAIPVPVRRK